MEIPVIIIDSITTDNVPILIKIDVEGFESRVLNGMTELLTNRALKAIIIEISDSAEYGGADAQCHQILTAGGFTPYKYDPFTHNLTAIKNFKSENVIYCRDIDMINNRLQNASAIEIMGELI